MNESFREGFEKTAGVSHEKLTQAVLNRLKNSPDASMGQKLLARIPGYSKLNAKLVGGLSGDLPKGQQRALKKDIVEHYQKYRK